MSGVNVIERGMAKLARSFGFGCGHLHTYSQEGEDMILSRYFAGKSNGVFVDVGAHHPVRYSNTYLFYKRGWRGINIDAMPGSMVAFNKLRPLDRNIEAAIASVRRELQFFVFNDPAVNTCDPVLAEQRDGAEHFKLLCTHTVKTRPLAEVLHAEFAAAREIDLLSVDVEGFDLDVLQSNDWSQFSPRVVVAETYGALSVEESLDTDVGRFMTERGYAMFAKTVNSVFFHRKDDGRK